MEKLQTQGLHHVTLVDRRHDRATDANVAGGRQDVVGAQLADEAPIIQALCDGTAALQ